MSFSRPMLRRSVAVVLRRFASRRGKRPTACGSPLRAQIPRGSIPPSSGGVAISLDDGPAGVGITSVATGSEAERAGLAVGDRILAVDGRAVANVKEAQARLFGPVADDVVVELSRGDQKQKLRVSRERVHR